MPDFKGLAILLPPNDREFRPYFKAAGEGRLSLPRCCKCGACRYPPGVACPWCSSLESEWQDVSGRGIVYSYEIVTHAIQPGFAADVPYVGALIELDFQRDHPNPHESIRIASNLVEEDFRPVPEEDVAINARVDVIFQSLGDGLGLPMWRLTGESPAQPVWRMPR